MSENNDGKKQSKDNIKEKIDQGLDKIEEKVEDGINKLEDKIGIDLPDGIVGGLLNKGKSILKKNVKKYSSGDFIYKTANEILKSSNVSEVLSKVSQGNLVDIIRASTKEDLDEFVVKLTDNSSFKSLLERSEQLKLEKNIRINRNDAAILRNLYEKREDPEALQKYLQDKGGTGYIGRTLQKVMKIGREQIRLPPDFKELPRQNLFLGEIVVKGFLGKFFPLVLSGLFLLFGFLGGIYSFSEGSADPFYVFFGEFKNNQFEGLQAKYSYWILFIAVGAYILSLFASNINKTLQQTHRYIDLGQKKAKFQQTMLLGWPAEIAILLISVPCIYFDLNNFQSTVNYYLVPNDFMSWAWFGVFVLSWIYFVAFIWLSTGFFVIEWLQLKKSHWRSGIEQVVEKKEYKPLLNTMITVYLPILPYILVKVLFQIYIIPSTMDIAATFILVSLFLVGLIGGPLLVAGDVKYERKGFLEPQQKSGFKFVQNAFRKIVNNEKITQNDVMKAMLVQFNTQNVKDSLKEKILESDYVKKLVAMIAGPVLAYLSQLISQLQDGIGVLSEIFRFLNIQLPG